MAADRSSQLINVDGYATSAVFKSVPPEANSTLDPRAETKNFERPYLFPNFHRWRSVECRRRRFASETPKTTKSPTFLSRFQM